MAWSTRVPHLCCSECISTSYILAAATSAQVKDATADGGKYLLKMDTEGRMTHIFWMTATQVRGYVRWKEGRTPAQCK